MDIWTSARDQLPRQTWIAENPHPLDEVIFESMAPGITKLPTAITCEESHRSSIWYQVFNLHESYADILHFIQTTIKHPAIAFQTDLKVQELTARLDRWLRNLPASLLDTPENVRAFIKQGRGRDLSVLHLLYHHQSQLLYFQYLYQSITDSSDAESSPKTTAYATRCKAHAEALSELMWRTNTTRGLECLWSPVNGHLLVVASSVHLYSLLFDDDDFCKPKIRRLLEQNFVMLLQFQKYWPTLTASMSRLQAFHRSCYRGHRESSFKMDEWMLKFLNDYDSPIEDRMPSSFEATGPSKSVEREDANQMALQGLTYNAQSNLRYFLSF
ncbi:hypothetical protein ACHAPJ_009935 [Fusarium lateritium]